jgi:hypothetical protein
MILYSEGATKAQEDEANNIIAALDFAYPGHPWAVRVYGDENGGGFFIKHLGLPSNWGMNCRKKFYSASQMKKEVIFMAGEFLERAGMSRSQLPQDPIKHVEGVPDNWQPHADHPNPVQEVAPADTREVLMPQAQRIITP